MKMAKCVVWDLDDTLWVGTLSAGDEVQLKPGITEVLWALDQRGILQSIASKNNHADAWAMLDRFGIVEYFLCPQITWNSKSSSITAIRERLNIGADTIIFVDDQAYERDEVRSVLPEVHTVDAADYAQLPELARLSPAVVTEDARRRRQMYLEDRARDEAERVYVGPRGDFLCGLGMVFRISRAQANDLTRLEELTKRTNQLNSTGVQYSATELMELADDPDHDVWVGELTDRYGSYGKVGLAVVHRGAEAWTIRLILMSCRTISKGIGTIFLSFIAQEARRAGVRLRADFLRTDRNRQMLVTYQLANFQVLSRDGDRYIYENDLSIVQDYPDYVQVSADHTRRFR